MTNFLTARYCLFLVLLFSSVTSEAAETDSAPKWSFSGAGEYTSDSDTIISTKELLQATHNVSGGFSFNAQLENIRMEADRPSGLATIQGSENVLVQSILFGAKQQYNDCLAFEMMAGLERSSADTNTVSFLGRADWQPVDPLHAVFTLSRKMYAVSPRAISLDVTKTGGRLQLIWQAAPRLRVEGSTAYDDFSDDNIRRSFIVAPSYRVIRDTSDSLDAGFRYYWYAFNNRLNNGYYSPEGYHSYTVPFTYYHQFEEHNILVSLAPGVFKDQNNRGYQFAGDAIAEANFKMAETWDFNAHVMFIRSGGITSGDYEQGLMGITLTHHF